MPSQSTILLDRKTVRVLLSLGDCITAVETAFCAHAEGKTITPDLLHFDSGDGEFHVKAGGLRGERTYFALKVNGGFFGNPARHALPAIQGLITLHDGENGSPLAVMDSGAITVMRTGAATAVAARYLALPEADTATICGCGTQGRIQLRSLAAVLPLRRAYAWSRSLERAQKFAAEMSSELGIAVEAIEKLISGTRESQVVVTCTPAREAFLAREHVRPGTFIAAVGADSPDKQELEPSLIAASCVVVDLLEQCAAVGELHHAIRVGLLRREDVHAELGPIIAGHKPGRQSNKEIIVFDSTGTALQDAAAAVLVYERAVAQGAGQQIDFAEVGGAR